MAWTLSALLEPGTHHRVVNDAVVELGSIADVVLNDWQLDLHQSVRRIPLHCGQDKTRAVSGRNITAVRLSDAIFYAGKLLPI